jgi:rubrerythrin
MSEVMKIELIDADGAIREMEDAVAGDTRADLFRKAAIGGGSLVAGGALLSGFPELAAAAKPSKKQDVAILNYALTLEYLEAAFYNEGLAKAGTSGALLTATKLIAKHENAHVAYLKKALGKSAVKKPKFDFGAATATPAAFLKTAVVLEDTGVKAYSGQATRIKQAAVVKAAVSILTVEARHAAYLRGLDGQTFAPRTFDTAASMKTVLKAAGGFIKK